MKFKSCYFLLTSIAFAAAIALPPSRLSVCDICIGVVVQMRRSPESLVMCEEPLSECMNITKDVYEIINNPHYESNYYTPEEMCAELYYCTDYDNDKPPVIIDNARRRLFFEELAAGDTWGEFP